MRDWRRENRGEYEMQRGKEQRVIMHTNVYGVILKSSEDDYVEDKNQTYHVRLKPI